ncbi:MAG TPA: Crp/Fnr family transcriptional regulator [Candidatus Babeliales bacterium]|nr:Crp/Fnr family transcriptional regulator [Candidatus Babeliales bacterium]
MDNSENIATPEKSIADLFHGMPSRHFPAKQMLFYRGDEISRIYYVVSGYVRMYTITNKGNERTLTILGPGESLPIIQTEKAEYFYDAITDVETVYGTLEELIKRFLADPQYMDVARASGVIMLKRMMEQMEILAGDTAREKIETMLAFLGKYYGEPVGEYHRLCFKITHQELGNLVNATRETVSQNIAKLERGKKIKTDKNGMYLVKVSDYLEDRSNPDG